MLLFKTIPRYVYLSLFLLLAAMGLYAQRPLIFKQITVDNGLPQNTVMSILQDKRGMIWVGTFDGLSKFNGNEFSVYKNEANHLQSLSNNQVNTLFEDRQHYLWVSTVDGINLYNRETDSFIRYTAADSSFKCIVLAMVQDDEGTIWAGSGNGLISFNPEKNSKSRSFQGSAIVTSKIQSLYIDHDQNLWIGTPQGLRCYNLKNKKLVAFPLPMQKQPGLLNDVVRTVIQDHDGNFWIATETEGLFYYNVKKQTCVNYNKSNGLLSNTVRALLETENNLIWVGTKNGLNTIDIANNKISAFTHDPENPTSLSQNSIRSILKDNEGNIWIGTYNGGVSVVYRQFDNFYHFGLKRSNIAGLSYPIVNTVMQDHDGSLWIGTDDGGLNHADAALEHNQVYYQDKEANKELWGISIKAIARHPDTNLLWVGTGSGLKIFDKHSLKFTDYTLTGKPEVKGLIENYFLLTDAGGLWVATNFGGLSYIDGQKVLKHYLPGHAAGSINSNNLTTLLRDGAFLWIGTKSSGLNQLNINTGQFKSYVADPKKPYSLSNNAVVSIYKDAQNKLWVGTDGGGLNYMDVKTGQFYSISEATGIKNNTIHQMLEDRSGRLWLSTNKGISGIGFKKFSTPFKSSDLRIANYTVEDGLQSNQFTTGVAIKTTDGKLVFGGINGLTIFNPDGIRINNVKPPVIFTDFLILNKPVQFGTKNSPLEKPIDETAEITLTYNQAFFSIKYAALNYINPQKNQFAYKLEGFSDDEWHYVGNQQMATYTNLDPGTYLFKIKAANNDGVWNDAARVLKIKVLPPWYKTWYAYISYTLVIMLLLYLFNNYSKKTERLKAQLEFESISHIKDQELAQKKLSFFTNISHEIKTPLTMIMAPMERLIRMNQGNNKVQHQLMLMQRNGERLIRLINQLLDIRKFESGNMHLQAAESDIVRFIQEIALAINGLAKSKHIDLIFKADEEELMVWFDADKLEKVCYNLLSNAIKFTPEYGTITLHIERATLPEGEELIFAVADNGCGIPAEDVGKLFKQFYHNGQHHPHVQGTGLGLAFSKELVELHHGSITVKSEPENGARRGYTRFEVHLPLGRQHLKDGELAEDFKNSEDFTSGYQHTEKSLQQQFSQRKAAIIKNEDKEKLCLLIIEDNDDVRNFVKAGFEDDFEVLAAANGLDGWSLAKAHIPDLIISDVMMPKMNGIELCRKLKSDIDTSHIPVILLTARTPLIFKMEGLETGADDYVTKPFSFSLLEARVWNLIEGRQKLRQRYQKDIMLEPQHIAISDTDEQFITRVLSVIENHLDEADLSVEQLSREVAMSRGTFTKKIKALTNQTGLEFIRSIRLKRAAQLLSYGQLNVNEVAYQVGFLDVNYFRRCFKEQFGYTPKVQSSMNNNALMQNRGQDD